MAIYRSVQMSFWTDSKVVDEFTPEDRYFYLYLMTNPHTNLAGCYEISLKQISDETGYSKETVQNLINRMESVHNVIRYSKTTKEVLIIKWSEYNWTKSKDFQKPLIREIESIKNADFKGFLIKMIDRLNTVPTPSQDGAGTTVTVTVTDTVSVYKEKGGMGGKEKPLKHKHGSLKNVLLTDAEYERLKKEYPDTVEDAIEYLSKYKVEKDYKTKSDNLTIRRWVIDAVQKHKPQTHNKLELKI